MNGIIFDIQRFSVHDGPGIRTTVFFKGCPLRCRWCHNPEGLIGDRQLQFFEEKCIGCGRCGTREQLSDADKCPADALCVCGSMTDADEVFARVLRDMAFYGDCGGMTLSGGECLLQADFAKELLERAKIAGIHTAVDTCGYVSWENIEKTLPFCDLYLYDIKCIDPANHKKYTGVDNRKILENFDRLAKTGKDIWVRIPLIPGFNNTDSEMIKIAELISRLLSDNANIRQVTLMPYHSLGKSKYKTLGLEYGFDSSLKISDEESARYKILFENRGITIA